MAKYIIIGLASVFLIATAAYAVSDPAYYAKSCDDKCKLRILKDEHAQVKKENQRLKNRKWVKAYKALDLEHKALKKEANLLRNERHALQLNNAELDAKNQKLAADLKQLWERVDNADKDVKDCRSVQMTYRILYKKCADKCPAAK